MKKLVLKAITLVTLAGFIQGCDNIPVTKGEVDPAFLPVVEKMMGSFKGLFVYRQESNTGGNKTVGGAEKGSVEMKLSLEGRRVKVTTSEDPTYQAMGRDCGSIVGNLTAVTMNKTHTKAMAVFNYYPSKCLQDIEGRALYLYLDIDSNGKVTRVNSELKMATYQLPIPGHDNTVHDMSRGTFYPIQ